MTHHLSTDARVPGPDEAAHQDGLLMHELVVVNTMLAKYVLRYADADAKRAEPIPVAAEYTLANRLTAAAGAIQARANRRARDVQP